MSEEKKWTPGPWTVDSADFTIHATAPPIIRQIFSALPCEDRIERRANCDLAALAPELYDALEKALPLLYSEFNSNYSLAGPVMQLCEAVLAKARGENPT